MAQAIEWIPIDGSNIHELDEPDACICKMLWSQHMDMFRRGLNTAMHGILYLM